MTTNRIRTLALFAAGTLALAACSSSPADDPSNAGPGNPTATSAAPPNEPGNGGDPQFSTFCEALAASDQFETTSSEAQERLDAALENSTDPGNPESIAAVRAWGAETRQISLDAIAYYEAMAATVNDPEVLAALDNFVAIYELMTLPMADAAMNAEDTYSYAFVALEALNNPDLAAAMENLGQDAQVLSAFASTNCGGF